MREATDLSISANVRRELSGRRVDLSKLKFPVTSGNITLQGEFSFVGIPKMDDEIAIELKFIESSLGNIDGVKSIKFELTNWKKSSSGTWQSSESQSIQTKSSSSQIKGDGLVCPECDYVIRFCPCCGKPLSEFGKHTTKRKSFPPIKPSGKKNRLLSPIKTPKTPTLEKQKPVKSIIKEPIVDKPNTENEKKLEQPRVSDIVNQETKSDTPLVSEPNTNKISKPQDQQHPALDIPDVVQPAVPTIPAAPVKPVTQAPESNTQENQEPMLDLSGFTTENISPKAEKAILDTGSQSDLNLEIPEISQSGVATTGIDSQEQQPTLDLGGFTEETLPQTTEEPIYDEKIQPELNLEIPEVVQPVTPTTEIPSQDQLPTLDLSSFNINSLPETTESPMHDATIQPELNLEIPEVIQPVTPTTEIPSQDQLPAFDLGGFPYEEETPLPPTKAPEATQPQQTPAFDLGGFPYEEETPLPPTKAPEATQPQQMPAFDLGGFPADDETPLPPMKAPELPETNKMTGSKDPFAALFTNNSDGSLDGSGNFDGLDLDLEVVGGFPNNENEPKAPPKATTPPSTDPTNIDGFFDLDKPLPQEENGSANDEKDPFGNLDDFDISKFKL